MKKLLVLLGVLVVVIIAVLFLNKDNREFLTIDINPSIGLYLDEDVVKEVVYLNDEAYMSLYNKDLVGKKVDDVLEEILDVSLEMGYIDELSYDNLINVTTYNDEEKDNEELNLRIRTKIENKLKEKKVQALVIQNGLNEEIKGEAEKYGVSFGKMLLVKKAIDINSELKEEDLVKKSVRSIQSVIQDKSEKVKESIKDTVETLNEKRIEETKININNIKDQIVEDISGGKDKEEITEEEVEEIYDSVKEMIIEQGESIKEELKNNNETIKESIRNRLNIR